MEFIRWLRRVLCCVLCVYRSIFRRVKKRREGKITLMFHLINFYRYHNINLCFLSSSPHASLSHTSTIAIKRSEFVRVSLATPCNSTCFRSKSFYSKNFLLFVQFPDRRCRCPYRRRTNLRNLFQSNSKGDDKLGPVSDNPIRLGDASFSQTISFGFGRWNPFSVGNPMIRFE